MALKIYDFFSDGAKTAKSLGKMLLKSRPVSCEDSANGKELIIMGNGPSLTQTLKEHDPAFQSHDLMMVNFAALTPVFRELKPEYYILADPYFFNNASHDQVKKLNRALEEVDWKMTLFVPVGAKTVNNPNIRLRRFNMVSGEGYKWFKRLTFNSGLAMPRPRNVLIPSIMNAIRTGYKKIYLTGADHSWTRTLDVDDDNRVVSVQPHFYEENDDKDYKKMTMQVYSQTHLHQALYSFFVAFRSYHEIKWFAQEKGVEIINATPRSMIDAFPRGTL